MMNIVMVRTTYKNNFASPGAPTRKTRGPVHVEAMKAIIAVTLFGWLTCSALLADESASAATPLFRAIRDGDRAAVRTLLQDGAAIHARDELGNTPLMAAALNADATVLALLLEAGADVNATNQAGANALMRAATFAEKTRLLVAQGADVKARSRFGNTAVLLAARQPGNSGTVKLLLDRGADPNATNVLGSTPLMAASAAGDADSVRALLDAGAEVNAKPDMDVWGFVWGGGRTPLMWAAFRGDEAVARLLLERGAKVNEFTVGGSALTQAAWGGHVDMARLLLEAGAQIDQRDLVANYTPLHWAASSERSSSALVEFLLAHGADPNAEGGQPVDNFLGETQTPLSLARKRGDTPIVQALLKAGAKDTLPSLRKAKSTGQIPGYAGAKTVAEAVQRALGPLAQSSEESVPTYLRHASHQDCIACHQQQLPLAAMSLANARHLAIDREAMRHQLELVIRSFSCAHIPRGGGPHNILEINYQTAFHPEPAIYDGYVALDLKLEHQAPSEITDSMVHQLATIQYPDGHWISNLPRPPIQASDITATASAIHTLQSFGIPARQSELQARVERARVWLAKADAETNEERVHQLLGLAWAGEELRVVQNLAEELIRQQHSDGGWGQLAGLESDAYATGQSLYALMEGAKMSADHSAVRRGVEFLLRTQLADGTWHVRTRAHPFQPPMQSGFPHGRDSWISSAGSSWAVMALATSLDPSQMPPATPVFSKVAASPAAVTVPSSDDSQAPVEFSRDIQPVLERSCVACHSGQRPKGGFALRDRASLLKGGNRGQPVVVPGQPEAGELLRVVQDQVEDLEMPPPARRGKYPALTKDEVAKLNVWIAQGAKWPEEITLQAPKSLQALR
jgi:ankyrin repeat protein/mono/diheme cytochrome c family protein